MAIVQLCTGIDERRMTARLADVWRVRPSKIKELQPACAEIAHVSRHNDAGSRTVSARPHYN